MKLYTYVLDQDLGIDLPDTAPEGVRIVAASRVQARNFLHVELAQRDPELRVHHYEIQSIGLPPAKPKPPPKS